VIILRKKSFFKIKKNYKSDYFEEKNQKCVKSFKIRIE